MSSCIVSANDISNNIAVHQLLQICKITQSMLANNKMVSDPFTFEHGFDMTVATATICINHYGYSVLRKSQGKTYILYCNSCCSGMKYPEGYTSVYPVHISTQKKEYNKIISDVLAMLTLKDDVSIDNDNSIADDKAVQVEECDETPRQVNPLSIDSDVIIQND